jgi:hypothetical protein
VKDWEQKETELVNINSDYNEGSRISGDGLTLPIKVGKRSGVVERKKIKICHEHLFGQSSNVSSCIVYSEGVGVELNTRNFNKGADLILYRQEP